MLPCEDRFLQLCDGKPQLRHTPAANKKDINNKNFKNVTRYRDSRTAKSKGRDNHIKQSSIQSPYFSFLCYTRIIEKDPFRGVVYLTVLCDRPYLVSLLFAVLLFLHLVTFLMFFITCNIAMSLVQLNLIVLPLWKKS